MTATLKIPMQTQPITLHSRPPAAAPATSEVRWTVEAVAALFDLPFPTLMYQAQTVHRAHFDATQEFPWANIKKMGELGLLGIPWAEALGGAGLDTLSFMIVIHEMAKVDASHGITISAHTTLGTSPIVNFGNDAQRERFVPLLASGRVPW